MEVHHHPNVEKKNFKEYFLEFLMIFLAVTMGFFAENIRERFSDNERVHQLSLQLIEDLKKDTANLNQDINIQTKLENNADSVFKILQKPMSSIDIKKLQQLIARCFEVTTFTPSSGAISSIKNQMNLKQFSHSKISIYINDYETAESGIKEIEKIQIEQVRQIVQKFMQDHFTPDDLYALRITKSDVSGVLKQTSPNDLEELRSGMVSIEDFNRLLLHAYKKSIDLSLKLMQYVQKEYDLKNE